MLHVVENRVVTQSHSRSFEFTLLNMARVSSDYYFVVPYASYLSLKNIMTLKSGLGLFNHSLLETAPFYRSLGSRL